MNTFYIDKSVKLLVCDMAGTTVNEGGIVYKTLYETIKNKDISIKPDDMKNWYGVNKTQVLQHFMNTDDRFRNNNDILKELLNNFKQDLKNYFEDKSIKLIDDNLPILFNKLRKNGIKIGFKFRFFG